MSASLVEIKSPGSAVRYQSARNTHERLSWARTLRKIRKIDPAMARLVLKRAKMIENALARDIWGDFL